MSFKKKILALVVAMVAVTSANAAKCTLEVGQSTINLTRVVSIERDIVRSNFAVTINFNTGGGTGAYSRFTFPDRPSLEVFYRNTSEALDKCVSTYGK